MKRRLADVMKRNTRGSAIVEAALMAPWIFFLFMGVFDAGFYAYSGISTQNAARAAALAQAESSTTTPCAAALAEMNMLLNTSGVSTCTALPVIVTVNTLDGSSCPDAGDGSASANASSPFCVQASVQYQTIPLFPLPVLTGQWTFTRTAYVRLLQ
jgi:Flp pilus assembly protein TadG